MLSPELSDRYSLNLAACFALSCAAIGSRRLK
jgi:hypothetical protein